MRKRRIMVLMHEDLIPPDSVEGYSDKEIMAWKTEFDVCHGLRELGHEVHPVGVHSDLGVLRKAIDAFKPHVAFNLLEEFHGVALYDQHVVSYLELLRTPYTGCNPRGLTLAHDKALSKKVLSYHRIPVPKFATFRMGEKVKRPKRLEFPLMVKSLVEEASLGISQASVVHNDEKLTERVAFIHEKLGTDAIVEQYLDGREMYVGVMGNTRLQTFPIWELMFSKLPEGVPRIATEKVKWDEKYQEQVGMKTGLAKGLDPAQAKQITHLCKRVYRVLGLTGYARIDLRVTESGEVYVLEANPNPDLSFDSEFAESAHHAGMEFPDLLKRIVGLGLSYRALWRTE